MTVCDSCQEAFARGAIPQFFGPVAFYVAICVLMLATAIYVVFH